MNTSVSPVWRQNALVCYGSEGPGRIVEISRRSFYVTSAEFLIIECGTRQLSVNARSRELQPLTEDVLCGALKVFKQQRKVVTSLGNPSTFGVLRSSMRRNSVLVTSTR